MENSHRTGTVGSVHRTACDSPEWLLVLGLSRGEGKSLVCGSDFYANAPCADAIRGQVGLDLTGSKASACARRAIDSI